MTITALPPIGNNKGHSPLPSKKEGRLQGNRLVTEQPVPPGPVEEHLTNIQQSTTNDLINGPNKSPTDEWMVPVYRESGTLDDQDNLVSFREKVREQERERRAQKVAEMWLEGYSINQIAKFHNTEKHMIYEDLASMRSELRKAWDADLHSLAAERLESLRHVIRQAYTHLEKQPMQAPQLLGVVLRSEETIAKIQGVLTDKLQVIGKVEHTVKLYDFEDKLPSIEGSSIQGEYREVDASGDNQ